MKLGEKESNALLSDYFFFFVAGSCSRINDTDEIAIVISRCNTKITSLDFWKTPNLSQVGVGTLSSCCYLEEVDFGWW